MVDDKKECSSGGTKKATYFINNKDDNLRHWLYCLASEQLLEIGVSEVLLCPLGSAAQACNTHSMRKCHESPSKTWGFCITHLSQQCIAHCY